MDKTQNKKGNKELKQSDIKNWKFQKNDCYRVGSYFVSSSIPHKNNFIQPVVSLLYNGDRTNVVFKGFMTSHRLPKVIKTLIEFFYIAPKVSLQKLRQISI